MAERYVVDASVLIQRFIADTYTQNTKALLSQSIQGTQLFIPEFCLLECVNVLWKRVRFLNLTQSEASQSVENLLAFPLQVVLVSDLLPQALQIGLAHQLAVYDSLYIALALSLNCPLVTVDDRQLQAAIAQGSAIAPITDFSAV